MSKASQPANRARVGSAIGGLRVGWRGCVLREVRYAT